MTNSHKDSYLQLSGNLLSADQYTTFLAHYDITANDVITGIQPINPPIYTQRKSEGKFGGGIAIEEGTTNLIPNGTVNMYPSIGNGWGSYQTNQYNNNQYFSIGTILSVSSNIVTYSGNHQLRTYDVVTPQYSSGGVTNGTDYFVKALSDTQFTLHSYNNSQDGSQGFSVFDSINNDIRVPITNTNFPNMWWGPPHLPNSDTLKELHYDGFSSYGEPHDYLRIYTNFRTDGVVGGIAYGVNPQVTSGNAYTISFYQRAVDSSSIGQSVRFTAYTNGNYWINNSTFNLTGDWERVEFTATPTQNGGTNFYWFPPYNVVWDLSEIQIEQKSFVTSFTESTRSDCELTYPSNGVLNPQSGTINLWVNVRNDLSDTGWRMIFVVRDGGNTGNENNQIRMGFVNNWQTWHWKISGGGGASMYESTSITEGWHMASVTWDKSSPFAKFYLDGKPMFTSTDINVIPTSFYESFYLGNWTTTSDFSNHIIDELRIDSIARTDEEIMSWYLTQLPFYPKGVYRLAY